MDGVRRQLSEAWVAKLVAYANSFFMKIHVPGYTFTSQLPFKTDNQPGGRSDVWIRERASHRGCLAHALQWGPGSAVGRGRTLALAFDVLGSALFLLLWDLGPIPLRLLTCAASVNLNR